MPHFLNSQFYKKGMVGTLNITGQFCFGLNYIFAFLDNSYINKIGIFMAIVALKLSALKVVCNSEFSIINRPGVAGAVL